VFFDVYFKIIKLNKKLIVMNKLLLGTLLFMYHVHSTAQMLEFKQYVPQPGEPATTVIVCDLTGKETPHYVPLMFSGNKQVDETIYNVIKEEFDSTMQSAFNAFWDAKYAEHNGERVKNEVERRKIKIEVARINVLKSQFKYNDEVGISNDSLLIEEYCQLCKKHNIFFPVYCDEWNYKFSGEYFIESDSLIFFGGGAVKKI